MTEPPRDQQCLLRRCERPAVDPLDDRRLCARHLEEIEGATDDAGDAPADPDEHDAPGDAGGATGWDAAAFDAPESGVYSTDRLACEQWMGRKGKLPFAPWGDRDEDLECTKSACRDHGGDDVPEDVRVGCDACRAHREGTTTAECDHDARYKWGFRGHYVDGESVAEYERMDPRLDGRAFIQRDGDGNAFVDGDNVLCPESGDVHPVFVEILKRLGVTYADVSVSSSGVHAEYAGDDLPGPYSGQETFPIDDEPWGANDEPPSVEIYANKHVCVATGKHVPGTPADVRKWDEDGLRAVLEEYADDPTPDRNRNRGDLADLDLDNHDPGATGADETTSDYRDVLKAVDRLDPSDLRLDTDKVGTDSTGWVKFDPSSYRTSSGGDSLHYEPTEGVFYDQKKDEGFGVLGLVAAEENIITNPWDRLAGDDFRAAVDAARDQGAAIPEYTGTTHTAVLPPAARDLSDATTGWDWRHAAEQGEASITTPEARERTTEAIADAYDRGDHVLIEALPTMGKTYGSVEATDLTGKQVSILTGRGNREQYRQIKEWCEERGLDVKILPAFHRDCDTANGEHGEEVAETVRAWYQRGATGKDIHMQFEAATGRPIPCDGPAGARCPWSAKWSGFDPDEYDVLIGGYQHAHVGSVTQGRTVVLDEFPDGAFETRFTADRLAASVTRFLERHAHADALPEDYTDLMSARDDEQRRSDALAWFGEHEPEREPELAIDTTDGHAEGGLVAFTLLATAANGLGNGWERVALPGNGVGAYDRLRGEVHLLHPPDLQYASGVVALDGTPTKRMWELALGERLNHRQVLQDEERAEYIRDALNLNIVQTSEHIKPYNSTDHVHTDGDAALLERIAEEHGEAPGLITSATALEAYKSAGVLDYDPETGEVRDGPADRVKWHGDVLGSNEFDEKRVGSVFGSNHYGDGYIKKWGAYAGEAAERGEEKGADLSYGWFGDQVLTHMREHDTLQAVMRFGRDGRGAVVYVHTNTLPDWVPVAAEGRVIKTWSDGLRGVLEALEDMGQATTAAVADHPAVDLSRQQVFAHLEDLRERGVLTREQDEGDGRRVVWRDDGLHRLGEHGDVELGPVDLEDLDADEVRKVARTTTYTWEFTNHDNATPRDAPPGEGAPDAAARRDNPPPERPG